jgi:hypothetical protein
MSTANNRRPQPGGWSAETIALWCAITTITTAVLVAYAGVQIGHRLAGLPTPTGGLWETVFGLLGGDVAWPGESTAVAVTAAVLLAVLAALVAALVRRSRGRRSRVDDSARYLGRGRDIESLTRKNTTATARRLGVDETTPGVPIGTTVTQRRPLFGSWEDMHIDIWGPRTGKTTSPGRARDPGRARRGAGHQQQARRARRHPRPAPRGRAGVGLRPTVSRPGNRPSGGGTRCPTSPTRSGREDGRALRLGLP